MAEARPVRRVTIRDIAKEAGVSRRRLVRPEQPPRRLGGYPRAHPVDREPARLVPEPGGAGALGGPRRRVRARTRAAGSDDRARAVLHGVHRRGWVGLSSRSLALTLQLVDNDAGGGRGLPAVVGRAPGRRHVHGRPAYRHAGRAGHAPGVRPQSSSVGRFRRHPAVVWHDEEVRRGRGRPLPGCARACADGPGLGRDRLRPTEHVRRPSAR